MHAYMYLSINLCITSAPCQLQLLPNYTQVPLRQRPMPGASPTNPKQNSAV